jgi:hypothetical protein
VLRSINESAFAGVAIRAVAIPKSAKVLRASCFADCAALATVRFEAGSALEILGAAALARSDLTAALLPSSVASVCASSSGAATHWPSFAVRPRPACGASKTSRSRKRGHPQLSRLHREHWLRRLPRPRCCRL